MALSVNGGLGVILSTFTEMYEAEGYGLQTVLLLVTLTAEFIGVGMFSFSHLRTRMLTPYKAIT